MIALVAVAFGIIVPNANATATNAGAAGNIWKEGEMREGAQPK